MIICFAHLEQAVSWELEPVLIFHLSSVAGNRVCHDPLSSTGWCQQSSQWHSFPPLSSEASLLPAQSSLQWSYRHFPQLSAALAGCCLWISQQGMLWHTPVWDCGHGHRGLGSQVGGSSWRDGVMQGDNDLLGEEVLSTPVSPGPSSSHSQLSLSPPMAQVISVGLGLEMHATLCPLVCSAWLGYRQCWKSSP